MPKADLDGYVNASSSPNDMTVAMAEYLGIKHRYIDSTMTGGSSFEFHVQHAAAAIKDGVADAILVTYGSDQLSRMGRMLGTGGFHTSDARVEGPASSCRRTAYRSSAPTRWRRAATCTSSARRPSSSPRSRSASASSPRYNPLARYRDPITIDDVLNSRMVADPLHKLDCCVITDGGGAFIMTTEERARDLAQPPVYVLGAAGTQTHWNIIQMPDFTEVGAATAGPEALGRAGVTVDDIDVLQLYDSFTITVLMMLEGLGFAGRGEGGAVVQEGHFRKGGKWPMNTDGGGLSSNHPGMRGIFLIIEAVRQLRGQAGEVQVPDCEIALACGSGGWLSCMGAVVMGKDRPS